MTIGTGVTVDKAPVKRVSLFKNSLLTSIDLQNSAKALLYMKHLLSLNIDMLEFLNIHCIESAFNSNSP